MYSVKRYSCLRGLSTPRPGSNQKSSVALRPKSGAIKNMFWGTDRTKDKGERLEVRPAG